MTVGTVWIEDYFGKVERMTMRDNTYHIYHNIYGVAEAAAEHLKLAGYKAHAVIPNGLYRPDSPARRSGRIARVVRPFAGRPGQRRCHQEPDLRNQRRARSAQGEYQNDLQQLHHRLQRPDEAAQGA